MTYQKRLPFSRKRTPITCGHPKANHYAHGMCVACYARDYRQKHPVERLLAEAKSKAKRVTDKAAKRKEENDELEERLLGSGIRKAG